MWNKHKSKILAAYLLMVSLFFSSVNIPCKVAFPVTYLALVAGNRRLGWMIVALCFSAVGDYMGALHHFPLQMGTFALAHCAFILHFIQKGKGKGMPASTYGLLMLLGTMTLLVFAYGFILPAVYPTWLRLGVAVYVLLILGMLCGAFWQRDFWIALGGLLFVFSDAILAWNKFVGHVPNARLWIMIPYYAAQWLLFMRAVWNRK